MAKHSTIQSRDDRGLRCRSTGQLTSMGQSRRVVWKSRPPGTAVAMIDRLWQCLYVEHWFNNESDTCLMSSP